MLMGKTPTVYLMKRKLESGGKMNGWNYPVVLQVIKS